MILFFFWNFQCKEILQEEEDLSEIVQLVGKVSGWHWALDCCGSHLNEYSLDTAMLRHILIEGFLWESHIVCARSRVDDFPGHLHVSKPVRKCGSWLVVLEKKKVRFEMWEIPVSLLIYIYSENTDNALSITSKLRKMLCLKYQRLKVWWGRLDVRHMKSNMKIYL